jgi:hypothetical protein
MLYVALLLRFRSVELGQAEERRALVPQPRGALPNGAHDFDAFSYRNGYGNGNGNGYGHAAWSDGEHLPANNGDGAPSVVDEGYLPAARYLGDDGIQIIEEDVHVIVRRSDEVDVHALRAANGSTPE